MLTNFGTQWQQRSNSDESFGVGVEMSTLSKPIAPEQRSVREKCFHPTGTFLEFNIDQLQRSVVDRFERQVSAYAHRIAVKSMVHELTYDELNKAANRLARAI